MTTPCDVCGFDWSGYALCVECSARVSLVESRREAMRVWLDRGLTAKPAWWYPVTEHHDVWWRTGAPPTSWRDFEPAPVEVVPASDFGFVVRHGPQESPQVANVAPSSTNGDNPDPDPVRPEDGELWNRPAEEWYTWN